MAILVVVSGGVVLEVRGDGLPAGVESATDPLATGGLPAWEWSFEKVSGGKADEWDDYREAHPEWFGVTAPPVVPVRPFAEYEPAQAVMLRPSKSISKFHKGILLGLHGHVDRIVLFHVPDHDADLKKQLEDWKIFDESIEFVDIGEINANWTRDYGPVSNVSMDGLVGLVDFRYYHGRAYDDAIPGKLADHWGVNDFRPSMSFEGGNFMADPQGTCYATEKIYQQNAGYPAEQIAQWMKEYLGCTQLVAYKWPKGLGTGHVDMFSKLMNDTTVLLGEYDPELQPVNAEIMEENREMLEAVVTEAGESLEVIRLPLPWDDTEVWYTYTNSLIVNDVVLIPVYSGFKDLEAEALQAYEEAAPGLERISINSDSIIPAGGAIHCVTMSVPVGSLAPYQDPPVQLCEYNELTKCADVPPCGGLPYEGACEAGMLKYCGSDGYPHAQLCDECCGWDPEGMNGLGWYDCLAGEKCAGCADECGPGEAGCSAEGTHTWTCKTGDQPGCQVRTWLPCEGVLVCNPESAACEVPPEYCVDGVCPETCGEITEDGVCDGEILLWCEEGVLLVQDCAAENKVCGPVPHLGDSLGCWQGCPDGCPFDGARGCSEDGKGVIICRRDDWNCLAWALPEACEEGRSCFDGVCTDSRPEATHDISGSHDTIAPDESTDGDGATSCGCDLGGRKRGGSMGWMGVVFLAGLWVVGRGRGRGRGRREVKRGK